MKNYYESKMIKKQIELCENFTNELNELIKAGEPITTESMMDCFFRCGIDLKSSKGLTQKSLNQLKPIQS